MFTFNDGGRALAGFRGSTGDCVTRAIAIATEQPYGTVYATLWELDRRKNRRLAAGPRHGIGRNVYQPYLELMGWAWTPTMQIGSGCKVHLRADELPAGRIIARLSRHLCAVVDGQVHDTFDPTRDGTRCVYGYFALDRPTP